VKVIAAPNAFKESLSASAAASAIATGVRRAIPRCHVVEMPVADGGDGTREVLVRALGGEEVLCDAHDPLGRPIRAVFGRLSRLAGGPTAVVDVAAASGLALLAPADRDPMRASSFGTGEILRKAIEDGAVRVLLGVGGSATVDAGLGLLAALGAEWRDGQGQRLQPNGAALSSVRSVNVEPVSRLMQGRELLVLADVETPLLGEQGAAAVFGPQKGAHAQQVAELSRGLQSFAAVVAATTGLDIAALPRGGAAGGIAASLFALAGARLVSGIDCVLDLIGFDEAARDADLVMTGEGRLDSQTAFDKGPSGVARRARGLGVPTVVLAGGISDDFDAESATGSNLFAAALSIQQRPGELDTARRLAPQWLTAASEQAMRLYALGRDDLSRRAGAG
jgi:glycerate kinase